jgi:biotin carboxyl carrier protein
MAQLDFDLIRHALTTARENGFAEVELCVGDDSFAAKLAPAPPSRKPPTPVEENATVEATNGLVDVKATLVGYYRPAKTPIEVGMSVAEGDVVAIIGALGIANDVESPASGEVVEVLVEQNQPVEYGQVLARIKP